jgi:hypothetical protein
LLEVRTFKLKTVSTSQGPTLVGYPESTFTFDFPFIEQTPYNFIFINPQFSRQLVTAGILWWIDKCLSKALVLV